MQPTSSSVPKKRSKWILFLLGLALLALPIVYLALKKNSGAGERREWEEEQQQQLTTHPSQSCHMEGLREGETHLALVGAQGAIRNLKLWVDTSEEEEGVDLLEIDIMQPDGEDKYVTLLSRPICVSSETPNRKTVNVSAHLGSGARDLLPGTPFVVRRTGLRKGGVKVPSMLLIN